MKLKPEIIQFLSTRIVDHLTIDENNINYRKVFQMIKNKLARERGLIL